MNAFSEMLVVGGKTNSLGRVDDVIEMVSQDASLIDDLYQCLFDEDAWIRMRAADALEKVCRVHPDWLEPYIDKTFEDLLSSKQASIQWHLAQIYRQVALTPAQRLVVIEWLKDLLSTVAVDWIVSANSMTTVVQFTADGYISKAEATALIKIQTQHKSPAVVKRANKLLYELA